MTDDASGHRTLWAPILVEIIKVIQGEKMAGVYQGWEPLTSGLETAYKNHQGDFQKPPCSRPHSIPTKSESSQGVGPRHPCFLKTPHVIPTCSQV